MLEHIPAWLGALLRNVRAGHAKLVIAQPEFTDAARIDLTSPAFIDGGPLPALFTADGAGVSPPLAWGPVPEGTRSLALIVEDPDAPAPHPLTHAIVWGIPPADREIAEGGIAPHRPGEHGYVGRNSYLAHGWLPPDPPTGHGSHDYVFQLYALAETPEIRDSLGRSQFIDAIAGHVLATGLLVGTYVREERHA